MLVRHDAAREICFRERGAQSARLFGCRFSRRVREKFENRIARLQTQNLHRTFYIYSHGPASPRPAHAGEK